MDGPAPRAPRVVDFLAVELGDRSYLAVGGGTAVAVDPVRDVDRYIEAAEAVGARLTHVLETHVHNDYVSGGLELARRSGAALVLPERSGASFTHEEARDGSVIETGDMRVRAIATAGHTPEHTSYLIETASAPGWVFSGGSLLAGTAGRTDLLGPMWTDRLTASQYESVRRLAALPDETVLFPTHGAGSFCTADAVLRSGFSTIADERRMNTALADDDPAAFARRQLAGLLRYPAYYAQMAPINRAGPAPLGVVLPPPALSGMELAALRSAGVAIVDGRPRARFAEAHVAGSLSIELDDSFATYVGWLLPFDAPLAIVLDPDQDALEAARQLARIGFDHVRGVLRDLDSAAAAGVPIASLGRARVRDATAALAGEDPPLVVDVRQPVEWEGGTVPGSIRRFVADAVDPASWLPGSDRPVWTVCKSGYRAAIAASLLAAAGYPVTFVDDGGVDDVLRALRSKG